LNLGLMVNSINARLPSRCANQDQVNHIASSLRNSVGVEMVPFGCPSRIQMVRLHDIRKSSLWPSSKEK
jgi:hypothetical protein